MKYDRLKVRWSKRENDFLITFPRSCDGHLVHNQLFSDRFPATWTDKNSFTEPAENFIKELEKRGYDTKTLKFEVKLRERAE